MAKQVKTVIKLQIEGGKANPAPPVGPALGQAGINIMEFCKAYNDKTKDRMGQVVPVEITAYVDGTFDFILKTPPASDLIRKYANLKKGSQMPGREIVGKISKDDIRKISEIKMPDLNAVDLDQADLIIAGSARSMGIEVV
jgi:large subunit ribosomal protein L11|tara:strand:- start:15616 stop:16038 length:423 start_codon:yes stop_codon:yes gene_type:complete